MRHLPSMMAISSGFQGFFCKTSQEQEQEQQQQQQQLLN